MKHYDVLAVQHQRCTNDRNGNPRRLWVLFGSTGGSDGLAYAPIVAVIDEGYSVSGVKHALRIMISEHDLTTDAHIELPESHITATEYRSLLKGG